MSVFGRGGGRMASVLFAVRAEVPEAERARFDHRYETDHLPWAKREFGARRAWRCWSRSDPGVHVAFYEFDSLAAAEARPHQRRSSPLSPISIGCGAIACRVAARSSKSCRRSRPSGSLTRQPRERPPSIGMTAPVT